MQHPDTLRRQNAVCFNVLTHSAHTACSNESRTLHTRSKKIALNASDDPKPIITPDFLRMHHGLEIIGPRASIRPYYLRICMDKSLGRKVLAAIFSEYRTRCISARSPGFTHSRSASFTYYADLPPTRVVIQRSLYEEFS